MPGVETMQQIVLLISDDINGRAIVKNTLEQDNANVLVSENWQQCLTSVPYIRPDLILIDIVDVHLSHGQRSDMCRILKEQENTKNIPLIFMIGPEETGEKIMVLKAGAEDYISKPFQREELAARVRVHLENRYLRKLLEEKRSASGEGTHQSGILLSDMSHDIRTPLNAIYRLYRITAAGSVTDRK
jgi:DNA-binding response OmpR family regulator